MDSEKETIVNQMKVLVKDVVDYFTSVIELFQARMTAYALSTILFLLLVGFAGILVLISFTLFNVALGTWLVQLTGNPLWAILILGTFYGILGVILGGIALRWYLRLKS
ncbi:MAG: phage holin family protein [Elusimicrobia bacterium]|nr:phage holin family protein [Candidatus Obscuribacterium magneticum]